MQWYWGSTSGSTDAFPDVQWVSTQRTLPLSCIYLIFLWCFLLNCIICMLDTFQHNWKGRSALSACWLLFNISKGRSLWLHACTNQFSFQTPSRNFHYELLRQALGVRMWSSLEMGERDVYWVRRVCRHGWQWKSSPELDPFPYTLKLCIEITPWICAMHTIIPSNTVLGPIVVCLCS
jgi:hypothetical protein